MTDPRQEMMQLAQRAIARQLRLRSAVKSGRFRDHLKAEAQAARDRWQQFSDDASGPGELGGEELGTAEAGPRSGDAG